MGILRVYDIKTRMDSAAGKPVVRRASSGLGTIGARRAGRTPVPVVSGRGCADPAEVPGEETTALIHWVSRSLQPG